VKISDRAIKIAIELNSDPTTRNIRLAVVVANDEVRTAIQTIADQTPAAGARMMIFDDLNEAEDWLNRPIEQMI